ncbi:hypothetical protein [Rhizobium sp. AN80A]|uniref:hypothetical protein n=1 Tax=Rhizobium sp. AN80A TaxID=3040673 RepID=UPI0024B38FFA|nr:hypothetical protein [Rhizobium sp. AN80A]
MIQEFSWRPGIGDPTVVGWFTVALYLLAGVTCWRTAGFAGSRHLPGSTEAATWRMISVAFFCLGINKQLDLQSAFTQIGRMIALAGGWYEQRRTVQLYFILAIAVVGIVVTSVVLFRVRRSPRELMLALAGSMLVFGYVVIRAGSFQHVDRFIGSRVLAFKWNWILEVAGILIVITASEWRRATIARQSHRLASGLRH